MQTVYVVLRANLGMLDSCHVGRRVGARIGSSVGSRDGRGIDNLPAGRRVCKLGEGVCFVVGSAVGAEVATSEGAGVMEVWVSVQVWDVYTPQTPLGANDTWTLWDQFDENLGRVFSVREVW